MEKNLPDRINEAVEVCLTEAAMWLAWDGHPRAREGSVWTPNKAMRRVTDHLIDHLAQTEAALAGEQPLEDTWRGRTTTLAADWAPFTESELNEANARLKRLARTYASRLRTAGSSQWDIDRGDEWTVRRMAEHCAESLIWYAAQPLGRDVPMPD
jgi:hypothetical protein